MTSHDFTRQEILDVNNDRELSVQLPVEAINLLTQVRQSMTDIGELAESIRTKGQMTQGFAVALEQRQATQYLREINEMRQTEHSTKDLVSVTIDGTKYFVVLVAGHRRYLALRHLLKSNAKLTQKCSGQYRCVLRFGMSARAALEIQFQENRHKQVPLHEEAAAAWDFYRWQKRRNKDLTLKVFGKTIGRSSKWVRRAVRFCSLPDNLQKYATGDNGVVIPYGILAEAARLAEGLKKAGKPIDDTSLERLVINTVLKKTTVASFRKIVSARLEHVLGGQDSLFGDLPEQRRPARQVVGKELLLGSWTQIEYLRALEALRTAGLIEGHYLEPQKGGDSKSLYSAGSPLHITAELVQLFDGMLPGLEELAAANGGRHRSALANGRDVVAETAKVLTALAESEAAD